MSDFWARRLGTPPATPRQEPVAPATRPWWDVPTGQAPQPAQTPQEGTPPPALPDETVPPRQATSARHNDRCPACSSGSYFRPPGHPNAAMRCLECGFPNLHQLSGTGVGSSGEAAPSRQIPTGGLVPNYNPGKIVGRIDG